MFPHCQRRQAMWQRNRPNRVALESIARGKPEIRQFRSRATRLHRGITKSHMHCVGLGAETSNAYIIHGGGVGQPVCRHVRILQLK